MEDIPLRLAQLGDVIFPSKFIISCIYDCRKEGVPVSSNIGNYSCMYGERVETFKLFPAVVLEHRGLGAVVLGPGGQFYLSDDCIVSV